MGYEAKPGSGTLFRNKDRKAANHPNLKGSALLQLEDGRLVELELAAWTKESERAGKFLSLSVKLKGARQASGYQRFNERVAEMGTPIDDDMDRAFGPAPADDDEYERF
jgi:hypothetical protein